MTLLMRHTVTQPQSAARTVETGPPAVRSFTLRYAAAWLPLDEAGAIDDGQLLYRQRAPLTGQLESTGDGRDVGFSDVTF
jgi:hypothetical protein